MSGVRLHVKRHLRLLEAPLIFRSSAFEAILCEQVLHEGIQDMDKGIMLHAFITVGSQGQDSQRRFTADSALTESNDSPPSIVQVILLSHDSARRVVR